MTTTTLSSLKIHQESEGAQFGALLSLFQQGEEHESNLNILRSLLLFASIGLVGLAAPQSSRADDLFIGDARDNSVKVFDSDTGAYLRTFTPPKTAGLRGPMG